MDTAEQYEIDALNVPLYVTRAADGRYVVEAAGLGLRKTGDDLQQLEREWRAALPELLRTVKQYDIEPASTQPSAAGLSHDYGWLTQFSIAMLIIVAITLPLWAVWQGVRSLASFPAAMQGNQTAAHAAGTLVSHFADTVESLPPERRAELAGNVRRIANALEPFAAELRPLWLACCDTSVAIPPAQPRLSAHTPEAPVKGTARKSHDEP
jgi:hypothetical protein